MFVIIHLFSIEMTTVTFQLIRVTLIAKPSTHRQIKNEIAQQSACATALSTKFILFFAIAKFSLNRTYA